jgi:hypothetical protein
MFRFTRKPSSGSHSQYLAKITCFVSPIYVIFRLNVFIILYFFAFLTYILCTYNFITVTL